MSHRMNRRRFIQTTAASGMGALVPGSLSAQADGAKGGPGPSSIPAPGGLAGNAGPLPKRIRAPRGVITCT